MAWHCAHSCTNSSCVEKVCVGYFGNDCFAFDCILWGTPLDVVFLGTGWAELVGGNQVRLGVGRAKEGRVLILLMIAHSAAITANVVIVFYVIIAWNEGSQEAFSKKIE